MSEEVWIKDFILKIGSRLRLVPSMSNKYQLDIIYEKFS